MSEAFNLTNAEVDKRKLLEEIECLKLTATQAIEFNGLFLSEENVSSDHALFAQKSFDVGDYCRHGDGTTSNLSELCEKSNWQNSEAACTKMTSVDIELLKSSAANEDLSQALLMDNYRTDDVFDLNIGVHGNFDDFSYDHSRRGQAISSGDMISSSWMSMETDNKDLTQDIERLKLAASQSMLGRRILLSEENNNSEIYDRGSSVLGSIKDSAHSQDLDGDKYDVSKEVMELSFNEDFLPGTLPVTTLFEESGDEFCLALCQHYQSVLKKLYQELYLALENNLKSQRDEGQEIKQNETAASKTKRLSRYSKPFFKSSIGSFPPPANEDVAMKRASKELKPFVHTPKLWSEVEIDTLRKAVAADCLQTRLRPLMNKKDREFAKLLGVTDGSEEENKIKENLAILEKDINETRSSGDIVSVYGHPDDLDSIDWMKISNIDLNGQRTSQACKLFWKNAAHPALNRGKWTPEEDNALVELVAVYNGTNWQEIAARLGTNRTAFMCLQRYQTTLNPCLLTGKWTADEDEFLLEVVNNSRVGENISWNTVAYYVEGRSQEQCKRRWQLLNHVDQKKGRWTLEEDEKLKEAVQSFGTSKWYKIQTFVPGRTSAQCRERWTNSLNGALQFGNWSYEEDKKLWLQVKEIGPGQWQKLATECLPGRTDNMCLQRYRRLLEWERNASVLGNNENKENSDKSLGDPLRSCLESEELEQIKADQAQGIFVPRPATMTLDPSSWKRHKITRKVFRHGHKKWRSRRQKQLENKYRTKTRTRNINLFVPSTRQERQATIAQMTPRSTDDQLQQHPIASGHQLPQASQPTDDGRWLQPGKRPVGRQRISAEEADVDEKITALLRLHKTKQNSSGNHFENHGQQATDGRRVIGGDTESKVTRILTAAMNFKKVPELQPFIALPGYYSATSKCSNISAGAELNNCEPPTYGLPNASLVPNAGGRRSIQGQLGKRLYLMPALPPMRATINAFKCMQQNRAKLLELAGKFTVPGITPDTAQKKIPKVKNVELEGHKLALESDSVKTTVDSQLSAETDESKEMGFTGDCKAEPHAEDSASSLQSAMQKLIRKGRKVFREQIVKTRRMSHEVLQRAHASHDYQLLRSRFVSLFMWPALLSSVHVTDPLSLPSSMAFTESCSVEEEELTDRELERDDFENSSESDCDWKTVYKPRRRRFSRWKSKGCRRRNNEGSSGEKVTEDCSSSLEQKEASSVNESEDKKTVRKKRKHEEQPSESVQRRASSRIAERVETKRQKTIQMSVMAAAMNCSDTNSLLEDEELLSPQEKRFKVA